MLEPWRNSVYATEGYVSLLPVAWLKQFQGNELRYSQVELCGLADSLRDEGVKEPLMLIIGKKSRRVRLGEGNHRMMAADLAGIPLVPVRVVRYTQNDTGILYDHMAKVPVTGHFPAEANPLDVFDWDVFNPYREMDNILSAYEPVVRHY